MQPEAAQFDAGDGAVAGVGSFRQRRVVIGGDGGETFSSGRDCPKEKGVRFIFRHGMESTTMPRMGRLVLANYPHHVVQRGHSRQVVFAADEDYQRYLADLRELKDAFGVKVYAYCLMTNHVHLLLAPGEAIARLGQLMKALAARATRYRNRL